MALILIDYVIHNVFYIVVSVEWSKDGKTIDESSTHHKLVKEKNKFKLTLPSVRNDDVGQYIVKASDKSGETSATFSLNVWTEV